MLQEVGLAAGADVTTGGIKANFPEDVGVEGSRQQVRMLLVRLYFHPHDARTLHLSFDV